MIIVTKAAKIVCEPSITNNIFEKNPTFKLSPKPCLVEPSVSFWNHRVQATSVLEWHVWPKVEHGAFSLLLRIRHGSSHGERASVRHREGSNPPEHKDPNPSTRVRVATDARGSSKGILLPVTS